MTKSTPDDNGTLHVLESCPQPLAPFHELDANVPTLGIVKPAFPSQAKTQAECYDYLFELAVKMKQMGMDYTVGPCVPSAMELESGEVSVQNSAYLKKRKLQVWAPHPVAAPCRCVREWGRLACT